MNHSQGQINLSTRASPGIETITIGGSGAYDITVDGSEGRAERVGSTDAVASGGECLLAIRTESQDFQRNGAQND